MATASDEVMTKGIAGVSDHSDPWIEYRRQEIRATRTEFEARPDFDALVAEARARGFRRITEAEQLEIPCSDAYTWRGGVWIKELRTAATPSLRQADTGTLTEDAVNAPGNALEL